MERLISLIRKELLATVKNPRTRILLVGPPLLQLLIFSFAATLQVRNAGVAVINYDKRWGAKQMMVSIRGNSVTFSKLYYTDSREEARRLLEKGKVLLCIEFPSDFTKKLERGENAEFGVYLDGRRANAAQIAAGYLLRIAQRFPYICEGKPGMREPLSTRAWFNPNLESTWSTVPGLVAILVNLVVLLTTALSIAREKELGTYEQLLITPLTRFELITGKVAAPLLLGVGEGLIMALLARVLFRIPISLRNYLLLAPSLLFFVLAVSGIGLFVSSLAKTQQQAFTGAFTYQVPAVILSGFATPVENVEKSIRWLAYINPLQYAVRVCRALFLENPSGTQLVKMVLPLVPIAFVTLTASALLFRKSTG